MNIGTQILDEIKKIKNLLKDVMSKQYEQSEEIQEIKKELKTIEDVQNFLKEEMKELQMEMEKERKQRENSTNLILKRIEKMENNFKLSRDIQIACFRDMANKMENIDA
jgi:chromosome segregation ATPase